MWVISRFSTLKVISVKGLRKTSQNCRGSNTWYCCAINHSNRWDISSTLSTGKLLVNYTFICFGVLISWSNFIETNKIWGWIFFFLSAGQRFGTLHAQGRDVSTQSDLRSNAGVQRASLRSRVWKGGGYVESWVTKLEIGMSLIYPCSSSSQNSFKL